MELIPKQQVDTDIAAIESSTATFTNAINAAVFSLNNTYNTLWSLPEDRLTAVLQKLYDNNKLIDLFADHNFSAVSLNEIQDKASSQGVRAISVAARELSIVDGVVSLVPLPVIEQQVIEDIYQEPIVE